MRLHKAWTEYVIPAPELDNDTDLRERCCRLYGLLAHGEDAGESSGTRDPLNELILGTTVLEYNEYGYLRVNPLNGQLIDFKWLGRNQYAEEVWLDRSESWTKWLARIRRKYPDKLGELLTDEFIVACSQLVGKYFPREGGYTWDLVTGEGLRELYNYGPDSCMRGSKGEEYLALYFTNPERVAGVRIQAREPWQRQYAAQRYFGRALLWTDDEGNRLLDRIYPSNNGPHVAWLAGVAAAEGWLSISRHNGKKGERGTERAYSVTLPVPPRPTPRSNPRYPYLDNLSYTADDPKSRGKTATITLFTEAATRGTGKLWLARFDSTGGGWSTNNTVVRCPITGELVDDMSGVLLARENGNVVRAHPRAVREGYHVFIAPDSTYYPPDQVIELRGEWIARHTLVTTYDGREWPRHWCHRILRGANGRRAYAANDDENLVQLYHNGMFGNEYALRSESVEWQDNYYHISWERYVVRIGGQYCHREDPRAAWLWREAQRRQTVTEAWTVSASASTYSFTWPSDSTTTDTTYS